MMRRFGMLFTGSFALVLSLSAQNFSFDFWHPGKIVVVTGDTLTGQVKYSLEEQVELRRNGRVDLYRPEKVLFFEFVDSISNNRRQFYSLPYSLTGGKGVFFFFELLTEGKMTLLSKEAIESVVYDNFDTKPVVVNRFFVLNQGGTIQSFKGNRFNFLDLTGNKKQLVKKYMESTKYDVVNKFEFASLVQYYNSLP